EAGQLLGQPRVVDGSGQQGERLALGFGEHHAVVVAGHRSLLFRSPILSARATPAGAGAHPSGSPEHTDGGSPTERRRRRRRRRRPQRLVAANLPVDAGWEVVVLEAEADPGGAVRSAELTLPGFTHD